MDSELDALVAAFEGIARASYQKNVSIISLICNVQRTSHILERVRTLSRFWPLLPHICRQMTSELVLACRGKAMTHVVL